MGPDVSTWFRAPGSAGHLLLFSSYRAVTAGRGVGGSQQNVIVKERRKRNEIHDTAYGCAYS